MTSFRKNKDVNAPHVFRNCFWKCLKPGEMGCGSVLQDLEETETEGEASGSNHPGEHCLRREYETNDRVDISRNAYASPAYRYHQIQNGGGLETHLDGLSRGWVEDKSKEREQNEAMVPLPIAEGAMEALLL